MKIALKPESANNEAVLTKLIDTLGAEFFQAHFDVSRPLLVTEQFHHDYTTRSDVQRVAQPFLDEETIKPHAPGLRLS